MSVRFSNTSTGGSISIPEVTTDPISPPAQSAWVLRTMGAGTGSPIGLLLALTHATDINTYQFSYQTIEGPIIRTTLS